MALVHAPDGGTGVGTALPSRTGPAGHVVVVSDPQDPVADEVARRLAVAATPVRVVAAPGYPGDGPGGGGGAPTIRLELGHLQGSRGSALTEALERAEGAVIVLGGGRPAGRKPLSPNGLRLLLAACERARLPKLVLVVPPEASPAGTGRGATVPSQHRQDAERAGRYSTIDTTIIRHAPLMDTVMAAPRRRRLHRATWAAGPHGGVRLVAAADIAELACRALQDRSLARTTVTVVGPELLGHDGGAPGGGPTPGRPASGAAEAADHEGACDPVPAVEFPQLEVGLTTLGAWRSGDRPPGGVPAKR